MPSICYGFVQNAWRQDICSNCFRLKEEHQTQNHQNQLKKPFLTTKNYDFELKNQAGRYQSPVLNAYTSTSGIPRVNTAINKYTNRPKNSFLYSNYENKMTNIPSSSTTTTASNTCSSGGSSSSSSGSSSSSCKMSLNATERLERALVGGCGVEKIENLKSLPNPVSSNSKGTKNNFYTNNYQNNQNHFVNNNKNHPVYTTTTATTTAGTTIDSNSSREIVTKGILQNSKKNEKKIVQFVEKVGDDFIQKPQIQKQLLVTSPNCTTTTGPSARHSQMATNIQVDHNDLIVIKNEPKSVQVNKKGILTKKDNPGNKGKRKFTVNFPQEVCEIICDEEYDVVDVGDGDGEWVSEYDDESDDENDPNDTKSIPELLELGSTNDYERELNKITVKNTSFNSIKNNLLGYAPIEIGPGITGNTGGKSKPLISIGTFETRAEPPRKNAQKSQNSIKNDQNSSKNDSNLQKIDKNLTKIDQNLQKIDKNLSKIDQNVIKTEKISSKIDQNLPNKVVPQGNHEKPLLLAVEKTRNDDIKEPEKNNNNNLVIKSNLNDNLKGNLKDIKTGNEVPKSTSSKTDLKDLKSDIKIKSDELTTSTTTSNVNNSINNLFILNDGQIANKRTSFLHEIINKNNQTDSLSNNNEMDSLEISTSASKSRILKQNQINNNNDQNAINFRGIGEFDDSLELDSGLENDMKTKSGGKFEKNESSNGSSGSSGPGSDLEEQDEKCSSDSGNENDFSEKNLYISVEENQKIEGDDVKIFSKPKLSPDSLLFSNNGSSGSNESLVEIQSSDKNDNLHLQVKRPSIKGNAPLPPPTAVNLVKRLAPAPPPGNENNKITSEIDEIDSIAHENGGKIEILEPECDYDDVENLKCEIEDLIRSKISIESNPSTEDHNGYDDEDEVIYDDCMAIKGQSGNLDMNGKSTTGSYDFTGGSILDTESSEKLPDRQNNGGIEFIGIRKIDSESLLNPQGSSSMMSRQRSPSPFSKSRDDLQNLKKEKESRSTTGGSPKARRKVNQFFSTIGKKAGAAFAASRDANLFGQSNGQSSKSSMSNGLDFRSSNSREGITGYRRSMSQDEVSMTRTQEIYATLTPTSMKLRGLAPVLHKLSKLDKDKDKDQNHDQNKEKIFKKNKLSTSIKKFLRFNNNNDKETDYPQSQSQSQWHTSTQSPEVSEKKPNFVKKTESVQNLSSGGDPGEIRRTSSASLVSVGPSVSYDTRPRYSIDTPSQNQNRNQNQNQNLIKKPKILPKPPPPPQRVHSLESNNKNGCYGKPARPPPPVRSNRVAPTPQFVSVFDRSSKNNPANSQANSPPSTISRQGQSSRHKNSFLDDKKTYAISAGELAKAMGGGPVPLQINLKNQNNQNNHNNYFADYDEDSSSSSLTPPNKPKRRASINSHRNSNGDIIDSHHNSHQISNLNYETLKMIASQVPAKIDGSDGFKSISSDCNSFRWSHFTIDDHRPLASGHKYAFFEARWTGNQNNFHSNESLILLLEENSGIKKSESHFLKNYIEILCTFEDFVPSEFIPWEASTYLNSSHNVKVSITLVPLCHIQKITDYITNPAITLEKKYFALLQSMLHWSKEPDFNELLVLQNLNTSDELPDYNSILYIIQHPSGGGNGCGGPKRTSFSSEWSPFEISIKQILITQLLNSRGNEHDREILLKRISGSCEEVQAQLRLFCQLKLFGPKSEDLIRIRKYRSERSTKEWINKEIAISMKEAVQRTIQRHNQPITPLKKSYVEFLMMAEISVKNVLDFLIDLV